MKNWDDQIKFYQLDLFINASRFITLAEKGRIYLRNLYNAKNIYEKAFLSYFIYDCFNDCGNCVLEFDQFEEEQKEDYQNDSFNELLNQLIKFENIINLGFCGKYIGVSFII